MAVTVGVANPGTISGVGVAQPGNITGVGTAQPGNITGVVPNYGFQTQPYSATPINIRVGSGTTAPTATPTATGEDPYLALARATLASAKAYNNANIYQGASPDFAAIQAQARSSAENDVNPLYTQKLNDFVARQAAEKTIKEKQTQMDIKNLQDVLKNTQEGNAITGTRAGEDAAAKSADVAQAADWRQTDQGGEYDMNRISQAIQLAKSGQTGGLAAQAQEGAQAKFNTTESRQGMADQEQQMQIAQAKARTFEDLARSNTLAGESEGKGEEQANFDLTSFITGQQFDRDAEQKQLEDERQRAVIDKQGNYQKIAINNFLQAISDPGQRAAFAKTYGAYL